MGRKNRTKNRKAIISTKENFYESYTEEELKDKYNIESEAYGGVLCSNKQTGTMSVFVPVVDREKKIYCKVGV